MKQGSRRRRAQLLLDVARRQIQEGIASALLDELPEAKAHGKRAGRLIFEAIVEADFGKVWGRSPFPPSLRPQPRA